MKKIYILMASAALMFAASCNTLEEVNTDSAVETELITVELNPATKTALGKEGATTWSEGDAVSVTVGGKNIGTLNHVEGNKFSGDVEAGHIGTAKATLNYPAGVTEVPTSQKATPNSFAEEAALLEGTTTMDELRAGQGPEMMNKTALLKFTVAQAGDVTFEVGTKKYTVTGCKTGSTYYACVAPVSDASFVARINGYLSKKAANTATFEANDVFNLMELPAPVSSGWSLPGVYNEWSISKNFLYEEGEYYVAKNISGLDKGFKFNHKDYGWKGVSSTSPVAKDQWHKFDGDANISLSDDKAYDIYMTKGGTRFQAVSAGSPIPQKPEGILLAKENYLYLNPSMWNVDGARFAAYFFGNGDKWVSMTDPDKDGIYEVEKQTGFTSVIFCRMSPNSQNSWNNKWNQSGDLDVPTDGNNLFTPSAWDGATTTWTKVIEF